MRFELKLEDGSTVEWDGETGEDAARRFVDCCPDRGGVVASRNANRHGIFQWGRGSTITGPDGKPA